MRRKALAHGHRARSPQPTSWSPPFQGGELRKSSQMFAVTAKPRGAERETDPTGHPEIGGLSEVSESNNRASAVSSATTTDRAVIDQAKEPRAKRGRVALALRKQTKSNIAISFGAALGRGGSGRLCLIS